ncbi:expressed unknown protein [Seminavis robusta]|uniref:Uncharacterized protein n=1 Tax=Seminavis robusta TaxID=568900 RepID=A0A9N8DDR1_9STRA|nr:expressed unknown protein [Seminavis robusta]|eukprot:Sro42_g025620.1 n/a (239) ;mRNA; f:75213-75929
MFRSRQFRGRRRWRWWRRRETRKQRGVLARLIDWWTRRQFYTFHKDEIITQTETCPSPSQVEQQPPQEDVDEWNNESESDDAGDLTSNDDQVDEYRYDYNQSDSGSATDEGEMLETIHEEASLEASPPRVRSIPVVTPSPPTKLQTATDPISPPSSLKIYQSGKEDSVSGSLESLDSLVSSQWDPEDDASTTTPLVTNISQTTDAFFVEHVKFLQIQTQPRKVEEVYHNEEEDGASQE